LPKLIRRDHKFFNLLQTVNILIGYLCGFGMLFPEYLTAMLVCYGIVGFAFGFFKKGLIFGPAAELNSD
jgi:hypothetical protein